MVDVNDAHKPVIVGNWKCNGETDTIENMVKIFNGATGEASHAQVVLAPAACHLLFVRKMLRVDWDLGAQDCWMAPGPFTGEISAGMLRDVGANWVILGHSERREIVKEDDRRVALKVAGALDAGLHVVLCVGETQADRAAGRRSSVIQAQLQAVANVVSDWERVLVAYEPLWAIGTGEVASAATIDQVFSEMDNWFSSRAITRRFRRYLYGGSVSSNNCTELLLLPKVGGFLVGNASTRPHEFLEIIRKVDSS